MQLIVVDTDGPVKLRAAAAFCLMLAGDIAVPSLSDEEVPAGTATREPIPSSHIIPFPSAPSAPVPPNVSSIPTAPVIHAPAPLMATAAVTPVIAVPPNFSQQPNVSTAPEPSSISTSLPASAGPVEYDGSGLPWDARIHQKGKAKKKDGTWKLQKGLDPTFAQSVVAELAAKRRAAPAMPLGSSSMPNGSVAPPGATGTVHRPEMAMPPMPSTVSPPAGVPAAPAVMPAPPAAVPPLPPLGAGPLMPDPPRSVGMLPELGAPYGTTVQPQFNHASVPPPPNAPQVPLPPGTQYSTGTGGVGTYAVPVSPQPNAASASMVPPPPVTAQVPVAPQPGPAGGGNPAIPPAVAPYRLLMDKLTAAVGAKQLDPRRIAPVCQKHGAPNFAELGKPEYAHLVAGVERDFDSLVAGLPVEGIT